MMECCVAKYDDAPYDPEDLPLSYIPPLQEFIREPTMKTAFVDEVVDSGMGEPDDAPYDPDDAPLFDSPHELPPSDSPFWDYVTDYWNGTVQDLPTNNYVPEPEWVDDPTAVSTFSSDCDTFMSSVGDNKTDNAVCV